MPIQVRWMSRYAALIAAVLALSGCNGSDDSDSASSSGSGGCDGGGGGEPPSQLESDSGGQQVELQWSEQEDVEKYNMYYATRGDIEPANFQVWRNEHDGVKVSGVTGGSHTVDELEAGTTYYFVMTSVTDGEESGPSNEVSATPEESGLQFSKLNDTGFSSCTGGSENQESRDCPVEGFPGQDGAVGRDAAARNGDLDKEGAGPKGFDFTKLDAEGNELPSDAEDWSCVRDNRTDLVWEVKTNSGLRDSDHTYTWYDPNSPRGNGVQGGAGFCGPLGECNTHRFVKAVNEEGLCGASDWRMPSVDDITSLYMEGWGSPLDPDYFPNQKSQRYWTGTPSAGRWNEAWNYQPSSGQEWPAVGCNTDHHIRLVRDADSSE